MTIRETELRERLTSDDDRVVRQTLRDHFEPELLPESSPLLYRWRLRPDVEITPDDDDGCGLDEDGVSWLDRLGRRMLGLANDAQRFVRARQFERMRQENPHWKVVVAEGDSWVAHPLVEDITDHLLYDARFPYAVLGVGAANDWLASMKADRDHERAVAEHAADALILSGGGNDLLCPFGNFLAPWSPGRDPWRLVDPAVDQHMGALMVTMRDLLVRARATMPGVPIVVHGYDYLRVAGPNDGKFLGPFFDGKGIDDLAERRAVLRAIVDRYNEHLGGVIAKLDGVTYVDLRGLVPDGEWHDEIHPNGDGFSRIAARLGQSLDAQLGD